MKEEMGGNGEKAGCNKTATESTLSGIITEQETKENY